MERVNNAEWCCDEIEELLKSYKRKYNSLRSIGEKTSRANAEIYYNVIFDLEKILYGENNHDEYL